MIPDESNQSTSGGWFSKWRKSSKATPNQTVEEALVYFRKLRTEVENVILNSKKVMDKQREWMACMDGIGRELKVFGNTDKQMHDRFHEVGDKLMALYTIDEKTAAAQPKKSLSEEAKIPYVVRYHTTKMEKALEWYRTFFIPGIIAYLELPQQKAAELDAARDALATAQKQFDVLDVKNNDPSFVKTPKHEKAYLEAKLKLKQQHELVTKLQEANINLEQNIPSELKEFRETMKQEIGEGLLQFVESRINSYKTTTTQFETVRQQS
jgi:hypothetical protein